MKLKETSKTCLVFAALKAHDDFMNYAMLMKETGISYNQVTAATHHLRKRRAIDCVVNPDGVAWWYPTPEYDNRTRHVDERAPELKPRKQRKNAKRGPRRGYTRRGDL